MVLELDVPYEGKELAARLHRDYMILSSIPSIVTIFTMDGWVYLHETKAYTVPPVQCPGHVGRTGALGWTRQAPAGKGPDHVSSCPGRVGGWHAGDRTPVQEKATLLRSSCACPWIAECPLQ